MAKLTKAECEAAARLMVKETKLPGDIVKAQEAWKSTGKEMLKKYIPQEIWDFTKKYKNLIRTITYARFYRNNETWANIHVPFSDLETHSADGREILDKIILPDMQYILISDEDYKKLSKAKAAVTDASRAQSKWISDTTEALYRLNSKTRISEGFPEALKYFNWEAKENAVAVYNYDSLRSLMTGKKEEISK